jgi:hypothetical protein
MYRRFFIHMEAKVFGGDNIPQERYTASAAPIIWERTWGLGIDLPRGFELRVTQHSTALLGRYKSLQLPIWRLDGPYGMYTTAGVRWSFGGWARSGRQR